MSNGMRSSLFNEFVSTVRAVLCQRFSNFFHLYFMEKTTPFTLALPIILFSYVLSYFSISLYLLLSI